MHPQYDDPQISTIEDLDPEPLPRVGFGQGREAVLGLLLLAGVLGWAGWQWWGQASTQNNYEQGLQAATRMDWDEAHSRFSQVSGYRDADSRAKEAASLIGERDGYYRAALAHEQQGEWVAALASVNSVIHIQPTYRDIRARKAEAEGHVYRDALLGTVALRLVGEPPGLYYRGEDEWVWLRGSDRYSAVLGNSSTSHIIYDVPGPDWRPPPSPAPTSTPSSIGDFTFVPGLPELKGRRIMYFTLGDGDKERIQQFGTLDFDPSQYHFYSSGKSGVWAIRYDGYYTSQEQSPVRGGYQDITFTYQAFGNVQLQKVEWPGKQWRVMELDEEHDRALIADWVERTDGRTVRLYTAGPVGEDAKQIYSHDGSIGNAQPSPDGRYVLLTTFTLLPSGLEKQAMVLIDVTGETSPRTLAEATTRTGNSIYGEAAKFVAASFIEGGGFAGHVIVSEKRENSYRLALLNPARPNEVPTELEIPDEPIERRVQELARLQWSIVHEGENELLLMGRIVYGVQGSGSEEGSLPIARFAPGEKPTLHRTRFDTQGFADVVQAVQARKDYLVYTALQDASRPLDPRATRTFYSAPLDRGDIGEGFTQIYSQTQNINQTSGFFDSYAIGSGALAYVTEGELHARTYDGKWDVKLEGGVMGLSYWRTRQMWSALR